MVRMITNRLQLVPGFEKVNRSEHCRKWRMSSHDQTSEVRTRILIGTILSRVGFLVNVTVLPVRTCIFYRSGFFAKKCIHT